MISAVYVQATVSMFTSGSGGETMVTEANFGDYRIRVSEYRGWREGRGGVPNNGKGDGVSE